MENEEKKLYLDLISTMNNVMAENHKLKNELLDLKDSHLKLQNIVQNMFRELNQVKSELKGKIGY